GIARVEGRIGLGEKIEVYSKMNPTRGITTVVTEFHRPQKMAWTFRLPFGNLRVVRTFTLSPEPGGTTLLALHQDYRGLLAPIVWRSMSGFWSSLEQFASGIKSQAEGTT